MAKGPERRPRQNPKPKADPVGKSAAPVPPQPKPEPSEMYKLFTKGRRLD